MTSLLVLNNISKSFPQPSGAVLTLFSDLSLQFEQGSIVSILGPNGCGKTTLFRIISGALSPDTGTVFLGNSEMTSKPVHIRSQKIGNVQQDTYRALAADLTVGEILSIAIKRRHHLSLLLPRSGPATAFLESLSPEIAAFLHEHIDIPTSALSGGQRQLLAIASSLLGDPDVLLLDEHTASIDEYHKVHVDRLVRQMADRNKAIVLCITHDREWAQEFSDFIFEYQTERFTFAPAARRDDSGCNRK